MYLKSVGQILKQKSPSDNFIVAKFYRPGRWTKEQIRDEHDFLNDLVEAEVPVIPPLNIDGETLFEMPDHKILYCLYEKRGGRNPEEMNEEYGIIACRVKYYLLY